MNMILSGIRWVGSKIMGDPINQAVRQGAETFERTTERVVESSSSAVLRRWESIDQGVERSLASFERIHNIAWENIQAIVDKGINGGLMGLGLYIIHAAGSDINISIREDDNATLSPQISINVLSIMGIGTFMLGFANIMKASSQEKADRSIPTSSRVFFNQSNSVKYQPCNEMHRLNNRPDGCSELMWAAYTGNLTNIRSLQRQGVFLEEKDEDGRTAVHWAVCGNQEAAVELLWFYGCNCFFVDEKGCQPSNYIQKNNQSLAALFEKLKRIPNRFNLERPIYFFYPPENLVFKGGGPKGIAYVGVQQYLEEKNLLQEVQRVAGTSAGAINAILVALGYKAEDMKRVLLSTDLKTFLDHPFQTEQEFIRKIATVFQKKLDSSLNECFAAIESTVKLWSSVQEGEGLIDRVKRVHDSGGLCKGDKFLRWIDDLIKDKTGEKACTFGQFKQQMRSKNFFHIYIYVTRVNPESIVCINSEDSKWDNVIIADAIRASMSIPVVFEPYVLRTKVHHQIKKAPEFGEFLDGGLLKNLPVDAFDFEKYKSINGSSIRGQTNHQTLAFNLVDPLSTDGQRFKRRSNLPQALNAGVSTMLNAEERRIAADPNNQDRIVSINNLGIGLITGFFSNAADQERLMRSGYNSIGSHFNKQRELAEEVASLDPTKILEIFSSKKTRSFPIWNLREILSRFVGHTQEQVVVEGSILDYEQLRQIERQANLRQERSKRLSTISGL